MPEMTPEDLARFRAAVQLRDRCVKAAVERMVYLGDDGDQDDRRAARVTYDAIADIIRTDERERLDRAGLLLTEARRRQLLGDPAALAGWTPEQARRAEEFNASLTFEEGPTDGQ